jgi:hypothetical protein
MNPRNRKQRNRKLKKLKHGNKPAIKAKRQEEDKNQDRKDFLSRWGGKYSKDLSDVMGSYPKIDKPPTILNRHARRYGLKYGLLIKDENENVKNVEETK